MSSYKEESCSLIEMNIDKGIAIIKRVLVDDSGNRIEKEETISIPKLNTGKAFIRKTQIDENGKTFETEEEIDVPVL